MSTLLYDITLKCNLRCKHCYNSDYFNIDNDLYDNFEFVMEHIRQRKVDHIHILGGEPFVSDKLWIFLDKIDESISVSINTNGTLLNNTNVRHLIGYKNIKQLTISLDGHNEASNSLIRGNNVFNNVIRNVNALRQLIDDKSLNIDLNLAFVCTPDNVMSISKLPLLAFKEGFNNILLSFLYYEGNARGFTGFKYNYSNVLNEIVVMLNEGQLYSIPITLDLKPAFQKLLEITSGYSIRTNENSHSCYVNENYFYISALNEAYPCGPSSKIADKKFKYQDCSSWTNFKEIDNEISIKVCKTCMFNNICSPCPIGIKCANTDMCEYALLELFESIKKYKKLRLIKSMDYLILHETNKIILVNFKNKYKKVLFERNGISSNHIEKIYDATLGELDRLFTSTEKFAFLFSIIKLNAMGMVQLG
ncbi:MAG: radical SAM protein [Ignavibacteriales bacterium]|nr:MAG: radical SAM protein [Ignavibacteriales bacterium]